MTDTRSERLDLTSFSQLIQEFIGGAIRRHTFTSWELELLLDLQSCRIRKSSRSDVLRRYLKAVQQQFACDESRPLRLTHFLEGEHRATSDRSLRHTKALPAHCA